MKKSVGRLLAVALVSALAVTTLVGQTKITIDEFGVGFLSGPPLGPPPGAPPVPLPFGIGPDPFSGMVTLFYGLPFAGTPGDILLFESTNSPPSDLLRFDGAGRVFFFSDAGPLDPPDSPADVPVLPPVMPGALIFPESGPEGGPNGLFGYTPAFGMPGFDPALPGLITYDFISDVPEPSTATLALLGGGLFAFLRRRNNRS